MTDGCRMFILRGFRLAAVWGGAMGAAMGAEAVAPASGDALSAQVFEERFQAVEVDVFQLTPSDRVHGWYTGETLLSHLFAFEATGKREHLEQFVPLADRLLALRNSERGLADYRGLELPAWLTEDTYLSRMVRLRNARGEVTLTLLTPHADLWARRTGFNGGVVRVKHEGSELFHLTLFPTRDGRSQPEGERRWHNLTMDRQPAGEAIYVEDAFRSDSRDLNLEYQVRDMGLSGSPGERRPIEGEFELFQGRLNRTTNTGTLSFPLAYFSRLVRESASLRAEPFYREKAEVYLEAARMAVEIHDDEWVESPDGRGWYRTRLGAPQWFSGSDLPINRFLVLGLALLEIHRAGGDPDARSKVEKMARTFRDNLQYRAETDAYVWGYWMNDTTSAAHLLPQAGEDIGHAGVNALFAFWCYLNGIEFTETDVRRLANTWLHLVMKPDGGLAYRIDGSDVRDDSRQWAQWRWALLGSVEPRLHEALLRWYETEAPNASGNNQWRHLKIAWAALGWNASRMGGR